MNTVTYSETYKPPEPVKNYIMLVILCETKLGRSLVLKISISVMAGNVRDKVNELKAKNII